MMKKKKRFIKVSFVEYQKFIQIHSVIRVKADAGAGGD